MKSKSFISCLILIAVVLTWMLPFSLPTAAATRPTFPSTDGARSVYLCHLESNQVLIHTNTEISIAPASTVKMMTALLAIEQYYPQLNKTVVITEEMIRDVSGTSMKLSVGMQVTVEDLLYGTLCGGYNDAAQALAVLCNGSVSAFVLSMNQRAKEIGMTKTNFTNPTGWDDPKMTTTLRDIVLLSKVVLKNPLYTKISAASSYTYYHSEKQASVTIFNRNAMVSGYYASGYLNPRAKGLIAGMTDAGGYCVASCLEYDGSHYLCIVMGAEETNGEIYSYKIANDLFHFMMKNYSYRQVCKSGTEICRLSAQLATAKAREDGTSIPCFAATDLYALLPDTVDIDQDLEYRYYFHEKEWEAPIQKGTVVGGVDIYFEDEKLASTKLVAGESVSANSFLIFLKQTKCFLISRSFLIFIVLCLLLLFGYWFIFEKRHRVTRTRKIKHRDFFDSKSHR